MNWSLLTSESVAENTQIYSLQYSERKKRDWREQVAQIMPPIFPMLMFSLGVIAFFVKDYFLLEVISVALFSVGTTIWLDQNRSKSVWIKSLINKTTERIAWAIYTIIGGLSFINPAVAAGTGGGGGCAANNTILGPIADALIGVFNSTAQVGSTGEISENLCQVFTTFAAIIALLIIGAVMWGLFDNQARGSDIGKAFAPLGLILAGVILTRISIKLVMGV